MSILVVDDNTMLLSKIVKSLALSDHEVDTATSMREAREQLAINPPSILCLDMNLPDGNGLELLEELHSTGGEMPVVIISGSSSREERRRAERLGAAGFLTKPFALSVLHDLLEELLTKQGKASELAELASGKHRGRKRKSTRVRALAEGRLERAKWAYSTRRVDRSQAVSVLTGAYQPRQGDLVLARVDKLNQHKRLELVDGRRATLFIDDEIVVCYGNRYAPDQFEAEVPNDLSPCNLVAAGGVAAMALSRNSRMKAATRITPVGVLLDEDGEVINLERFGIGKAKVGKKRPSVTAVIGTSMNAGKTTTLSGLALGMSRKGLKVGAAKVTGTGAGCDVWKMVDSGCHKVLDFTDYGLPATYKVPAAECEDIMESLTAELIRSGADTILLEVADGILQGETRKLVQSERFRSLVDRIVFAAGDALGAAAGVSWLQEQGHEVVGVSGALTGAPLATRECEGLVDVPVLTLDTLCKGDWQIANIVERPEDTSEAAEERDPRAA